MYQDLVDELLSFAVGNQLLFTHGFDEAEKLYFFRFQNQEQTWGFQRLYTKEELELVNVPIRLLALDIIDTLRKKVYFINAN